MTPCKKNFLNPFISSMEKTGIKIFTRGVISIVLKPLLLIFVDTTIGQDFINFSSIRNDSEPEQNPFVRWNSAQLPDPIGYAAGSEALKEQVRIRLDKKGNLKQSLFLYHTQEIINCNAEMISISFVESPIWLGAGKLDSSSGARYFNMELLKDDVVSIQVFAKRLGSPCEPSITILNHRSVPIVFVDDTDVLGGDLSFEFIAPESGKYQFELRDVEHRSGANNFFALEVYKTLDKKSFPKASDDKINQYASLKLDAPRDLSIVNQTINGYLINDTDKKSVALEVVKNCPVTIIAKTRSIGVDVDTQVSLFDSAWNRVQIESQSNFGDTELSLKNLDVGRYTIEIQSLAGLRFSNAPFQVKLSNAWKGFALSSDQHLINLIKGDSAKVKVSIDRAFGYKGELRFNVDESRFPDPGIAIKVVESKNETSSAVIELKAKSMNLKPGIHLIQINGFGKLNSGAGYPVSTKPSLEKIGLAASPKLLIKLDGIFFINVIEAE